MQEARRRRTEVSVELRKNNKDNQLLKRRNINIDDEPLSPPSEKSPVFNMSIDEIIIGMKSTDDIVQLQATQACRKMLSRERNPPINDMIEKGIVPLCIEYLGSNYGYCIVSLRFPFFYSMFKPFIFLLQSITAV